MHAYHFFISLKLLCMHNIISSEEQEKSYGDNYGKTFN